MPVLYTREQLAYCSNVHPGDSLSAVVNNIAQHFVPVKALRGLPAMASGLWLSAQAADSLLASAENLATFQTCLQQHGVLLTTLNGFPYGNFHQAVVKRDVYLPTWAEPARLYYTQQLARILALCLPQGRYSGAISTLPLAYGAGWRQNDHRQAVDHLIQLADYLFELEQTTGRRILVCLEMEPDCVLQYTDELVNFFVNDLLPQARLQRPRLQGQSEHAVLRYIGCCYDTCHQAVMNEDIAASLAKLSAAGIAIGKVQISNAVAAELTAAEQVEQLTEMLRDARFLHQTKVFQNGRLIQALADLDNRQLQAVVNSSTTKPVQALIHYHTPIHQSDFAYPFLTGTQAGILTALDYLQTSLFYWPFIEIETYTWLNFLADSHSPQQSLHQGLMAEFTWLEQALRQRNLLTDPAGYAP